MLTDFNKTIEKIHNYLYANDGLDNYEVLDVLLKVFYLKTYDELNDNQIASSFSSVNDYFEITSAAVKILLIKLQKVMS